VPAPEVESAAYWLSWINVAKITGAFLVAIGVAAEFVGDWVAKPLEDRISAAREAELAKANENAATARERTAQLEVTLEQERAARIRLQKQSADRHIDDEQQAILSKAIAAGPPNIRVFLTLLSDQEAAAFGEELARALQKAGASIVGVGRGNTIYPPPVGVIVEYNDENKPTITVLKALREAGIETSGKPTFPEVAMVRLIVGVKPNPK
jgi:hypothetical protein